MAGVVEQARGRCQVDLEHVAGPAREVTVFAGLREMHDRVDALRQPLHEAWVAEVERQPSHGITADRGGGARGVVGHRHDVGRGPGHPHELTADQAGRSGDEDRHAESAGCSLKKWLLRYSSTT